jgi:hypothetical protein
MNHTGSRRLLEPWNRRVVCLLFVMGLLLSLIPAFGAWAGSAEAQATTVTLIAKNSTWKYNDSNTDLGTAWRAESYDDSAWKSGKGPLGYPNGDNNSIFGAISSGTLVANAGNPNAYITYYFRNTFEVADLAGITKLDLTVGIDDGYVLYINGTEVRRLYMPEGEIGWQSFATYVNEPSSAQGTDTADITAAALPLLKAGTNTIAVEVHNRDNTSSDIYFDMELIASGGASEPEPGDATVTNIVVGVGSSETERTFTWYSNSDEDGMLQASYPYILAQTGGVFPTQPGTYLQFPAQRAATAVPGFYSYRVTVSGIESGTDYVYRVGNADGWSDIYELSTQTFGDGEFSFLFAGDPQIGSSGNVGNDTNGWTTTLNKASQWFPHADFLVSLGDQVEHATYENEYTGYLAPDVLRTLTLANNIGNHDSSGINFQQHFTLPNHSTLGATAAGGDYWWSYEGVLFLAINSNVLSTATHKTFLEGAIAAYKAQNGGRDPLWKIVTFHHSPYSTASHTTDSDILQRRNELPPVFKELGIDAVLTGHDHSYARSLMMEGTTPITTGYTAEGSNQYAKYMDDPAVNETVYFSTNSASGSKYYALKSLEFPFLAVHNQENTPNISKLDVTADSLTFTTYRTGANNTIENVVDTFTLVRLETQDAPTGLAGVAPTNIANSDGKITGVGEGQEYKLSTDDAYTPVTGSEITDLAPGTYLVRFAAKEGFHASETIEVTVPAFDGLAVNIGAEQKSGPAYKRVISAQDSGAASLVGKFLVIRFTEKAGPGANSWSMVIPAEVRETTVFYYRPGTKMEVWLTDGIPSNPGENKDVEVFAYTKSDVPVKSVSMDKSSLKLYAGQKQALTVGIKPADASNKAVTWSSSNEAVATVDENGLITAVAPGKAVITVTAEDGGKTAKCSVTVSPAIPVTGVKLMQKEITIGVGQWSYLNAAISPFNASNKNVSWSSSNDSVVSIDKSGKYTGLKTGTATITVKTEDGGKTATAKITVVKFGRPW